MIAKLNGTVDTINVDSAIIMAGGVGYLVFASNNTLSKLTVGKEVSILIETRVREDAFLLFGFFDTQEKDWFLKLTNVQGVGNKLGLTILSYLSIADLSRAIISGDKDVFKIVPGVGPKLGIRLITELRGKVADVDEPLLGVINDNIKHIVNEAVSALVNLGYKKNDAHETVTKIMNQTPEINLSQLITLALKEKI